MKKIDLCELEIIQGGVTSADIGCGALGLAAGLSIFTAPVFTVCFVGALATFGQGLGAGGASTAARTGAKLANLHKLSGELLPRLRQTQVICRFFI